MKTRFSLEPAMFIAVLLIAAHAVIDHYDNGMDWATVIESSITLLGGLFVRYFVVPKSKLIRDIDV